MFKVISSINIGSSENSSNILSRGYYVETEACIATIGSVIPIIYNGECIGLAKIKYLNIDSTGTKIGFTKIKVSKNDAVAIYNLVSMNKAINKSDDYDTEGTSGFLEQAFGGYTASKDVSKKKNYFDY